MEHIGISRVICLIHKVHLPKTKYMDYHLLSHTKKQNYILPDSPLFFTEVYTSSINSAGSDQNSELGFRESQS